MHDPFPVPSEADPHLAPPPETDECVVWWSEPRPWRQVEAILDGVELARIAELRRSIDRDRFATGCWLLRTVAGIAAGVAPGAVLVDRTCSRCAASHGRPRLGGSASSIGVSISHAGTRVGAAISRLGERHLPADGDGIGLDVEPTVALSTVGELADLVLSPGERREHDARPPARDDLLQRWVGKEASLKAAGVGLRVDPASVELTRSGPSLRLDRWPLPIPVDTVRLHQLHPGAAHVAMLATIGHGEIHVREHTVPRS